MAAELYNKRPMIRKDNSTGQQVAGFLDRSTGEFEVVMNIRDDRDIDEFMEKYNLSVVEIIGERKSN